MLLTIYTPTYNRKHLLGRLYSSLCRQTNSEFEWLVVDDGSTDGSRELIASWIAEEKITIRYVYKENGGVHTARDLAYEIVETELVWGVDSDDWLDDYAVENVLNLWKTKGNDCYCGIFAPYNFVNYTAVGYPPVESVSFQDLFYKYHFHGDQAIILVTKIIKNTSKYPVFDDEKLVSEGYKWFQLPDRPFLILKQFTTYVEYQTDGYTKNARYGYFKNLKGYFELHKVHVKYAKFLKNQIIFCVKYLITGFFLKKKKIVRESPRPFMTALLYPVSFLAYVALKFKWKKYR